MENIKEELRQMIKQKIVSTIMEGKKCDKCDKPVHAPSGASHQRPKSWNKGSKDGTRQTQDRREGKRQAQEMSESREGMLKSLANLSTGSVLLGLMAKQALANTTIAKSKKEPSIPYDKLSASDLFRRYQEITKPK